MADAWVTPSSIHSSCGLANPGNMIDDDTATGCSHYVTEEHYIVFDMGQTHTVKKIRMWDYPGWSNVTDIAAIYVSDDPENWGDSVGSLTFPNEAGEVWREADTTDKDGRYIKIVTPSEELYYWREFDIYGEVAAGGQTYYQTLSVAASSVASLSKKLFKDVITSAVSVASLVAAKLKLVTMVATAVSAPAISWLKTVYKVVWQKKSKPPTSYEMKEKPSTDWEKKTKPSKDWGEK